MRLQESSISVAELIDQFNRGDMVVNNEYQRQARLWPGAARSYFIDTILCGFPFPKIYVLEQLRLPQMRPFKEIVDGQQRVTTIIDYAQGRFALGKNSLQFAGRRYPDLDPEDLRFFPVGPEPVNDHMLVYRLEAPRVYVDILILHVEYRASGHVAALIELDGNKIPAFVIKKEIFSVVIFVEIRKVGCS